MNAGRPKLPVKWERGLVYHLCRGSLVRILPGTPIFPIVSVLLPLFSHPLKVSESI